MTFNDLLFRDRRNGRITVAQTRRPLMNQHASKKSVPPSVGADVSGMRRCLPEISRKFSVKVIRLAEGPQFRNFTPKIVCCACRRVLSSVTTHWTSSPAISERRIPNMFIKPHGAPQVLHNSGRLAWGSGPKGEAPQYTGVDFIIARDGKIAALYVYLDSPPS